MAIDRLLRFIATHESVFERVDDSSGHVQGVYYDAIEAVGRLAEKLAADEADLLPEKIMAALGYSSHGYLIDIADAVAIHLSDETLKRWDRDIHARQLELKNPVPRGQAARRTTACRSSAEYGRLSPKRATTWTA